MFIPLGHREVSPLTPRHHLSIYNRECGSVGFSAVVLTGRACDLRVSPRTGKIYARCHSLLHKTKEDDTRQIAMTGLPSGSARSEKGETNHEQH